jgi:hypothetical protein
MKQFLIKYRLVNGTREEWHKSVAEFIATLDSDPDLKGKIAYRCMTTGEDYYHIATPVDEAAVKTLQQKDFFKRYMEKTKATGGGEVVVSPLEVIAETAYRG